MLQVAQEKIHAKRIFEHIQELKKELGEGYEEIVVEAGAPTVYETTKENLKAAISGENHEHSSMYPEFAKTAEEEGLSRIAGRLRSIAVAEQHHEERFAKLLKELEAGTIFEKEEETWWICRECGYMHHGKNAPKICPSCDHPQGFYQVKSENY